MFPDKAFYLWLDEARYYFNKGLTETQVIKSLMMNGLFEIEAYLVVISLKEHMRVQRKLQKDDSNDSGYCNKK